MGIKNNVFGLEQVYRLQVEDDWSKKNEVFLSSNTSKSHQVLGWNYGYWLGGNSNTDFSRLDFSNDSSGTSNRLNIPGALSPISNNRPYATFGSPSKGYFVGSSGYPIGGGGPFLGSGTTLAFTLANDTALLVPGANKAINTSYGSSAFNTNYAYTVSASIERFDFANDTGNSIITHPSTPGHTISGVTGNQSYLWTGGGQPSNSSVDRLDYANDTAALAPKGPLSVARGAFAGCTGNADYGWWQGSKNGNISWAGGGTLVDRVDYSNDTATASPRGNLIRNASMEPADGAAGNSRFSWIAGYHPANNILKINYANDTVTSTELSGTGPSKIFTGCFSVVQYGLPDTTVNATGFAPTTYGSATGYFGGGDGGGSKLSTVDRIDYSNDTATASVRGPLSAGKQYLAATSNSFFGYFGGGTPAPTRLSTVDRIDYSNDTAAAAVKGPLSAGRGMLAATGNSSFGYFAGGESPSDVSTIDRIDYSNDTATASVRGPLSSTRKRMGATGNQSFGYIGGGLPPSPVSTVDRIDYSNDTITASPKGPLSAGPGGYGRTQMGGTSNADFGYFGGGYSTWSGQPLSIVDRIDYSNDTATMAAKGPLSIARRATGATGNNSFGYFAGGLNASSDWQTSIDRVDYSNDTATASPKGLMSNYRYTLAASSSHANGLPNVGTPVARRFNFATGVPEPVNSAYIAGAPGNSIHRYDYANDTTNLIGATTTGFPALSNGKGQYASSSTHGYWNGGNSPQNSYVVRLDYAAEDVNLITRASTPSVIYNAGSSYNLSYAWWGGGSAPSRSSNVTRLDYANDTTAPAPKGPLSASKYRHAATGNQNYGYHGGGEGTGSPSTLSSVDRIDYSNDTATATPKGPLSAARRYFGAASNADYGYFAGGDPSPYKSTVDRIDFANDTAVALVKSPLTRPSPASYQVSAFGSSDAAHVFGGQGNSSVVERLDYSNETLSNKSTGVSFDNERGVSARQNGAPVPIQTLRSFENTAIQAFPKKDVVYFAGGNPTTDSIHKFNLINDTLSFNHTRLTIGRGRGGGTGNTNFAYFAGGVPSISNIEKLDYSNDLAAAVPAGNYDITRGQTTFTAAAGNQNFGYIAHGYSSNIDRIDYSNDTATASPKGPLILARRNNSQAFVGNQSFGYYAGGISGGSPTEYYSQTDRVDYSNDTATALPRGTLTDDKYATAASANESFGYWTGGSPDGSYSGSKTSVDRLDFSNDTANMMQKGALAAGTPGKQEQGGTGNNAFGVYAGGPGSPASVSVLDYSNDTNNTRQTLSGGFGSNYSIGVSAAQNALLPNNFTVPTSVTATNFGYFISGPSTGILRIDYSNDTATGRSGAPNGNINSNGPVGASSQTYGYIAGGRPASGLPSGNPSNGPYHAIYRFDYQNDLYGLALRSQLTAGMYGSPGPGASVYNTNYGYWAGSWNLSGPLAPQMDSSAVNRLDYANDTTDAIIRGSLAVGQEAFSGSGNASSGWFIGGDNPAGRSIIQRMDYSSDTTWTIKSPLPENRNDHQSTGNASYAWIGGGRTPSTTSSVTRLDYGNDTSSPAPKGPLSRIMSTASATGNTSYGYFVDGGKTYVDRIDYSNDTATASPKGPLGGTHLSSYSNRGFSAAANALPQ